MKSKSLILIGVSILIIGFLFNVIFINIPPQDPSPEIIQQRIESYKAEELIYYSGFAVLTLGLILGLVRKIKKAAPYS